MLGARPDTGNDALMETGGFETRPYRNPPSLRGAQQRSNPDENWIAAPFGLAMTVFA